MLKCILMVAGLVLFPPDSRLPTPDLPHTTPDAVADLVLRHATIYTVDPAHPMAQSVAVKDGKILYVGTDAGVTKYVGAATKTRSTSRAASSIPGWSTRTRTFRRLARVK